MKATRELEGISIPERGAWLFDPAHTTVGFVARYLLVTKVRGRFEDVHGVIEVGDGPEDSRVEVTIPAKTITTSQPPRDEHLRSPDFLDVDNHPELTFSSTRVTRTGERTLDVEGDLTIRDVTRPVTLKAEYLGPIDDPWGNTRVAFNASTRINREDWGITWNQVVETGGVLVGPEVDIEIEVQALPREVAEQMGR